MSSSNAEQPTIQKSTSLKDISGSNQLHSKLNAVISNKINAFEREVLYEERFQVDRAKLEKMLMAISIDGKTNADLYFEQIIKSTHTQIDWLQWIHRSDINNKKHPFICVSGKRMEDVTWAKGLILAHLEVSTSVFRLKMAISNADHHFIMGRNNNNINRIMDDTQTHIQFPDPNLVKKGNQVTIHGLLEDLENARGLLRLSSPILMSFELSTNLPIPSAERIGNYFKVQVMFSSSSKPNTLLVLIRGSTRRVDKLKKAARSLLSYALGKMAHFTIVSVQLEVPPQHQETVKGENCENIISIMEQTNTKIFFPDLSIRGNRRSQVTITGSIDEVLMARAELVGRFPIELTFDISAENESATEIMELGRKSGVCITISHKERESGMSVTIKGSEKSIETIYEVHRSIRQINTMFPSDKYLTNSLYMFEDDFQHNMDSVMDNFVESLVERSETESDDGLSEKSPVISFPDSGDGNTTQQNNWTVYDPTYNQRAFLIESFALMDEHAQYCSPSRQAYQNCYNLLQSDVQDSISSNTIWIPSYTAAAISNAYSEQQSAYLINFPQLQPQLIYQLELQPQPTDICEPKTIEEIHETSIQQAQTFTDCLQQLEQDVQNEQLNVEILNSENDPESPKSVNSSPLIIGSEESVAGRLICTGWGNLF